MKVFFGRHSIQAMTFPINPVHGLRWVPYGGAHKGVQARCEGDRNTHTHKHVHVCAYISKQLVRLNVVCFLCLCLP